MFSVTGYSAQAFIQAFKPDIKQTSLCLTVIQLYLWYKQLETIKYKLDYYHSLLSLGNTKMLQLQRQKLYNVPGFDRISTKHLHQITPYTLITLFYYPILGRTYVLHKSSSLTVKRWWVQQVDFSYLLRPHGLMGGAGGVQVRREGWGSGAREGGPGTLTAPHRRHGTIGGRHWRQSGIA